MSGYPILNLVKAIKSDNEIELLEINTGVTDSNHCSLKIRYYYQVIEVPVEVGDVYTDFKQRAKTMVLNIVDKKFNFNGVNPVESGS